MITKGTNYAPKLGDVKPNYGLNVGKDKIEKQKSEHGVSEDKNALVQLGVKTLRKHIKIESSNYTYIVNFCLKPKYQKIQLSTNFLQFSDFRRVLTPILP